MRFGVGWVVVALDNVEVEWQNGLVKLASVKLAEDRDLGYVGEGRGIGLANVDLYQFLTRLPLEDVSADRLCAVAVQDIDRGGF